MNKTLIRSSRKPEREKTPQRSDNLGPRGESPGHELVSEVFGRLRNSSSGTSLEISFDMIEKSWQVLCINQSGNFKTRGFV